MGPSSYSPPRRWNLGGFVSSKWVQKTWRIARSFEIVRLDRLGVERAASVSRFDVMRWDLRIMPRIATESWRRPLVRTAQAEPEEGAARVRGGRCRS